MRSDRARVQDVLEAIDEVSRYFPSSRKVFDGDPPLQSHIYRQLMIIGEAAWRPSQPLKNANPHVPWKQIEGMRHIMVHDYFKVDWDIVYATAREDIPKLKPWLERILATLS